MAAPQWAREADGKPKKWAGGRIKLVGGVEKFVIERQVGPTKFTVTLETSDLDDARAELALFNRSPASYKSPTKHRTEAVARAATLIGVVWTDELVSEFLRFAQAKAKRGDLSDRYVRFTLEKYLADWTGVLGGKDMRSLRLGDLRQALKRWKGVAEDKRIVSLKAFTAWLRQDGKLERSEDPTLDLIVPQAVPSKDVNDRAYPIPLVEALYKEITLQQVRDVVLLRAKTGMHHTEVQGLKKAELREIDDPSGIAGMVTFHHKKKKEEHAISLDAQCFAAALRLAPGAPDHKTMWKHMNLALQALPPNVRKLARSVRVQPERLRHSFGTWAKTVGSVVTPLNQAGVPLAIVSERMGHLNKKTTAGHYLGDYVREMIAIPIKLEHDDDPAIAQPEKSKASRPSAQRRRGAHGASPKR